MEQTVGIVRVPVESLTFRRARQHNEDSIGRLTKVFRERKV